MEFKLLSLQVLLMIYLCFLSLLFLFLYDFLEISFLFSSDFISLDGSKTHRSIKGLKTNVLALALHQNNLLIGNKNVALWCQNC